MPPEDTTYSQLISDLQVDKVVEQGGFASEGHLHPSLGDVDFTGEVRAGGTKGITGSKTVGGFRITFKKGLLTGFTSV